MAIHNLLCMADLRLIFLYNEYKVIEIIFLIHRFEIDPKIRGQHLLIIVLRLLHI